MYLKIYPIKQKTCLKLVIGTLEHISWTYFKPLFNISLVRLDLVNAGGLFHSRVISITAITTIKKLCYIDFWRFSSGTMTSSEHLSDSMTSQLTIDDVVRLTMSDESLLYCIEIAIL